MLEFILKVHAQATSTLPNITPVDTQHGLQSKFDDILPFLRAAMDWLLGLAVALAVVAIVYSGLMYITSGGDQAKAESARKNLTWAIIGLLIALSAFVIVTWVSTIS